MAEKKEYFWNEFNPKWEEVFQMELLEYKDKMDLLSFYSAMADLIRSKGVNIKEVEDDYIEKQTLSFLYPLLKNGELVMYLPKFYHVAKKKNWDSGKYYMIDQKIYDLRNADEGMKELEKEWNNEIYKIDPTFIEEEVLFSLPENRKVLEEWFDFNKEPIKKGIEILGLKNLNNFNDDSFK